MFDLFGERPRKVHLHQDRTGETYQRGAGQSREYAHTLCKGNFAGPELLTTEDPRRVTCQSCKKKLLTKLLDERDLSLAAKLSPAPRRTPFVTEVTCKEAATLVEHGVTSFIFKFADASQLMNTRINLESYDGDRFVLGKTYVVTVEEKT